MLKHAIKILKQLPKEENDDSLFDFFEMCGGFHLYLFVCAFTAYSISAYLLLSLNPWYSKLQEPDIVPNCHFFSLLPWELHQILSSNNYKLSEFAC